MVLISRVNGKLYATGAFCSHYGVGLKFGTLFGDKVVCPAHAASFSVVDGTAESAPGLDSLPSYDIVEEGGKSYVLVPESITQKRSLPTTKRDPNDKRNFVIVGGGPAGLSCAETLRYSGYAGKVTLITKEKTLPYDRTALTKGLPSADSNKLVLRDEEWLAAADIDVVQNSVYSVHADTKQLAMTRGEAISYDKLLIATGTEVNKPPIPGNDAKGVFYLRTADDQTKIKKACKNVKTGVAIIGAGFIGSESAAALKSKYKDLDVHMIAKESVPMERALGKDVGAMLKDQHEKNGVTLHMNSGVKEIVKDESGNAVGIRLSDGNIINADIVLIGVGVHPNTTFLDRTDTGLVRNK